MVLQGEAGVLGEEALDVRLEPGDLVVLVRDGRLEFDDLLAQAGLDVWGAAPGPDVFVELVLEVGVALGQGVSGDVGFDGEGDDGQGAVGALGLDGPFRAPPQPWLASGAPGLSGTGVDNVASHQVAPGPSTC